LTGKESSVLPRSAKTLVDLKSLARVHTATCIRTLASIVTQPKAPANARVAAAGILLDRGWGKASQVHSDADGGPIQVIIRELVEIVGKAEPLTIEHDDGSDVA
jgi:hypothetical protein